MSLPLPMGLNHKTVAAAAADELRRRILDGTFSAGQPLRQEPLAKLFGVSRIPLREALLALEAEGLVRILPHRGAVVSELRIDEIAELFEMRSLLEPWLLTRSAARLEPEDFRQLRATLDEYSAEFQAYRVSRWGELNTRFHTLLLGKADKPRSLALVSKLLQECDRHTRLQLSLTKALDRAQREHLQLLRLCEAGKFTAAGNLLKKHIDNAGRSLCEFLRSHPKSPICKPGA